ncbi:hypothetical protein [Flavobacterium kingsejongi]|uniref:Knr4/Smi1-like domain-containing protein n=1 Tax=Flavobacterium kingsejongi TaxID=1678728 RepID=A0A2S1LKW9_9FLAO|nr:hypothetical protein [Flavobacterium kingsejongi]AWG24420.1 hypothetical protein FK004_03815 [Flavobacterium kingsejongi]
MATTLHDFQNRISKLNDDFLWYSDKKAPATTAQIQQYETENSLAFSDDIKEFLLTYGTAILEVVAPIWPRPNEGDVVPNWEFGYGFFIYGLSSGTDAIEWMQYAAPKSKEGISGQLIFKKSGNLYRAYAHQQAILIEDGIYDSETTVFDGNFYDFLIAEINILESDYQEYIARY